jgi:hypothetical protein
MFTIPGVRQQLSCRKCVEIKTESGVDADITVMALAPAF